MLLEDGMAVGKALARLRVASGVDFVAFRGLYILPGWVRLWLWATPGGRSGWVDKGFSKFV
jgi:hypothetical protein